MKAILMSIHPKWCEKIFNGEKTIEVRKTVPKLKTPFKVYVYCMKGKPYLYKNPNSGELFLDNNDGYRGGDYEDRYLTSKVIGSFVCDWIKEITPYCDIDGCVNQYEHHYPAILGDDCLSFKEMKAYLGNKKGYDWHITEPKLFDKPRELSEFYKPCPFNEDCDILCPYAEGEYHGDGINGDVEVIGCRNRITRPPQSWCYVEEEE